MNREEVIAILAKDHGILIGNDDPILSLLAVNQIFLDKQCARFQEASNDFIEKIALLQANYQEQAKNLANELVGGAVENIADAERRLVEALEKRSAFTAHDPAKSSYIEMLLMLSLVLNAAMLFLLASGG